MKHRLWLHVEEDDYRHKLRRCLLDVIDRAEGLLCIVRESHQQAVQESLADLCPPGLVSVVVRAEEKVDEWFDNGRLDEARMRKDAEALQKTLAPRTGRLAVISEVVDVLWSRARRQQAVSFEMALNQMMAGSNADLACFYEHSHHWDNELYSGMVRATHDHEGARA